MKNPKIQRTYLPNGTRGQMVLPDGTKFLRTIERAKNDPDHPCIAEGTYVVVWYQSPIHGLCFLLQDVPGRTMIEIHDCKGHVPTGLVEELDYVRVGFLKGCIGPGLRDCEKFNEPAVCGSPAALQNLKDYIGTDQQWLLTIEELKNEIPATTDSPAVTV